MPALRRAPCIVNDGVGQQFHLKRKKILFAESLIAVVESDFLGPNRLEALQQELRRECAPRDLVPYVRLALGDAELRQFLIGHLREHGPSTSRQMAEALIQTEGRDARDRRMMNDIVKRIGKALRQTVAVGQVTRTSEKTKGEYMWALATD